MSNTMSNTMQLNLFDDVGFNAARGPLASNIKPTDTIERLGRPACVLGLCGVYAVAYVSGKPLNEVFEDFSKEFKKRKSWTGGTRKNERDIILNKYGIKYEEIELPRQTLQSAICDLSPDKTYIVRTTSHIQIVENNKVIDQRGEVNICDYWGKRKFVTHIQEIKR